MCLSIEFISTKMKQRKAIQTRLSSCRSNDECFKLGRGAGLGIFFNKG
jgi:hypothetical protein